MSLGFCRENFDLNKNAIMDNKKKDYWVLDLFDGELCSHKEQFKKYMNAGDLIGVGDVIGV